MKGQVENEIEAHGPPSKRRKTHGQSEKGFGFKNFDLVSKKNENLFEKELDSKNCEIDYVFNSHKKRKFNQIDNDLNISYIPRPSKDCMIIYSKYKEFSSKIPRYCH